MSETPNPTPKTKLLAEFIGQASVFGIFLYFTGWIYRWSYFGYYQIDINTLALSQQSFLIVPLQVFLGSFGATSRALFLMVTLTFVISAISVFVQATRETLGTAFFELETIRYDPLKIKPVEIPAIVKRFMVNTLLQPFVVDIVIVLIVLSSLFWLASFQGYEDARRDAFNDTSTLPIVAYISHSDEFPLGRNLAQPLFNSPLKSFRGIGDLSLLRQLQGRDITDKTIPNQPVWRMLLGVEEWIYLVPAIPGGISQNQNLHPPVVAMRTSNNSSDLMLLSPAKSANQNP
ncbi:MAG: hypothetical protein H7Y37_11840 [Anaerolineae bacterium]|nr:hypothetical protein [Gloeobacterales cyanobacterium ES-bin-313]